MSESRANPSFLNQFISIAAILGCFVVFGLILYLTYMPDRPVGFPVGSVPPEERAYRLRKLRADEVVLAGHYSWVDQDKGIVGLPIERGMELVQQELSARSTD